MNIRIGNDIRLKLTVRGPLNYTRSNVKQIKCFLINECLDGCSCCSCEGNKCPIERRFPREPFPQYYTPTPYTIHNCGKPKYFADPWNCKHAYSNFGGWFNDPHWWPEYRGFGITPKKFIGDCYNRHLNHSMDIFHFNPKPIDPWHCDKCAFKAGHCGCTTCGDFVYMAEAMMMEGENRISCMFPAKDQFFCGSYKLVLVITTYQSGWGCHNLHTETIDYGTVFNLVDTEDGKSGNIEIDLDNTDPSTDNSNVSSISVSSSSIPAYQFKSGSSVRLGDTDMNGSVYIINVTTKGGEIVPYSSSWSGDKLIFTSSNTEAAEVDNNGNITFHDVTKDTIVTITITDESNLSISYSFDILVKSTTIPTNPVVIDSIDFSLSQPSSSTMAAGTTVIMVASITGSNLLNGNGLQLYKNGVRVDITEQVLEATDTTLQVQYNTTADEGLTVYTIYTADDKTKTASITINGIANPTQATVDLAWSLDGQNWNKVLGSTVDQTKVIELPNTDYNKTLYIAYAGCTVDSYSDQLHKLRSWSSLYPDNSSNIFDVPVEVSDYTQYLIKTVDTDDIPNVYDTFNLEKCGVSSLVLAVDRNTNEIIVSSEYTHLFFIIKPKDPVVESADVSVELLEGGTPLYSGDLIESDDIDGSSYTINVPASSGGLRILPFRITNKNVSGTDLTDLAKQITAFVILYDSRGMVISSHSATGDIGELINSIAINPDRVATIVLRVKTGIDDEYRYTVTYNLNLVEPEVTTVNVRYEASLMVNGAPVLIKAGSISDRDLGHTIYLGFPTGPNNFRLNALIFTVYNEGVTGENLNPNARIVTATARFRGSNDWLKVESGSSSQVGATLLSAGYALGAIGSIQLDVSCGADTNLPRYAVFFQPEADPDDAVELG